MKLPTRYALAEIGALAVLSLVHWGRKMQFDAPEIISYLLGVMPNVVAAIAIPFVSLSVWAEQRPTTSYSALRGRFAIVSIIAGLGLIAWEILQQSSHALVFDLHDIGATLMGLGIGILLFVLLTPKENEPFA
jgi:hypothetical protein